MIIGIPRPGADRTWYKHKKVNYTKKKKKKKKKKIGIP
jgi:hypothetical protein